MQNLKLTKTHIVFILCLSAVILRFLFYYEIENALWLIAFFLDFVLLFVGVAYVVVVIYALIRRRTTWFGLVSILIVPTVILLFGLTSIGSDLGLYFRLWRNESQYMKDVKLIMEAKSRDELKEFKYPIIIDEGLPIRIAFGWGGVIDNWYGIVYDPTAEVLRARLFKSDWANWDDSKLLAVKKLFGGDMTFARHLWGNWYFCNFT